MTTLLQLSLSRSNQDKDIDFENQAGEVIEGVLFVGSLQSALNFDELRKRNIFSILTAGKGLNYIAPKDEFNQKIVDLVDHPGENLLNKLEESLSFLESRNYLWASLVSFIVHQEYLEVYLYV